MASKAAGPYGDIPIPNGDFNLKKDGRLETKKTENCDNVAAWVSSSSAAWVAGLEAGSYRRGKHALYMNKGAWVEQQLQTVPALAGAWYTICVDGCRSAEKADQVVVEMYVDGRIAHTEKVGPLSNGWKTYQTQWHAPEDMASTATLKLRFTMVKAWGQIDNVRMHVGKTASAYADDAAAVIAERAAKEEEAFAMEAGGTPLNTAWSIWEHRKTGNKMTSDAAYLSGIARVADFRTIQGFFQFWNQLPLPSEFFTNEKGQRRAFEDRQLDGLSVFREGLSPTWEDPMNADGGEFFIRTSGNQMTLRQLDEYWEQTVLGMIGETLDPGSEICGARVVDKSKSRGPAYRLELWFRRNSPPGIGEDIKSRYAKCLSEVVERGGRIPKLDYRNHKF